MCPGSLVTSGKIGGAVRPGSLVTSGKLCVLVLYQYR